MHIHEYECKKCLHKFVLAHPTNDHGKGRIVRCPKCSGTHVTLCFEPLFTVDKETEKSPVRSPEHNFTSRVLESSLESPVINPEFSWHYRVLLELQARLRAERAERLNDAAEPMEPHSMDIADSASDEFNHDVGLAHLSATQDALYEIEEALRRLRDGTYGICEETGKRIPADRLRAVPWARFCRKTQLRLEKEGSVPHEHIGAVDFSRDAAAAFQEVAEEADEQALPTPEDERMQSIQIGPAHNRAG